MINILQSLTQYLLDNEEKEEESCSIPDESIADWLNQINNKITYLKNHSGAHEKKLQQLYLIREHLEKVQKVRAAKCQ